MEKDVKLVKFDYILENVFKKYKNVYIFLKGISLSQEYINIFEKNDIILNIFRFEDIPVEYKGLFDDWQTFMVFDDNSYCYQLKNDIFLLGLNNVKYTKTYNKGFDVLKQVLK